VVYIPLTLSEAGFSANLIRDSHPCEHLAVARWGGLKARKPSGRPGRAGPRER
jgi:hypothetical protein